MSNKLLDKLISVAMIIVLIIVVIFLQGCTNGQWDSVCKFKAPECLEYQHASA